jgi:heptosyltransferase-3
MIQTPRNILVVRTDRLGDVILTLPVCATLRKAMPTAQITMMVRRYVRPLVVGNPLVDRIIWEDDEQGMPRPFLALRKELRKGDFDAAIIVRPTLRNALLVATARIPVRIGTGYRWYSGLLTDKVYDHRKTAEHHELEYNLRLLSPLGMSVDAPPSPDYGIGVQEDARREIRAVLASFGVPDERTVVVLHPASGGSAREWPPERFREVGLQLLRRENTAVVVTGMPSEERTLRKFFGSSPFPFISLVGRIRLVSLAALLERASLFISNSTGPLHLANALGTQVIGLFPPVLPMSAARWRPYGRTATVFSGSGPTDCLRCSRRIPCVCMLSIPVDRVVNAAGAALDAAAASNGRKTA